LILVVFHTIRASDRGTAVETGQEETQEGTEAGPSFIGRVGSIRKEKF